uniref:Endoribonuclease Dicer n=1 Tax=Tetraselmis sp. GSL018 TaxID=582737 RepID=A0A061QQ54_9CHLO
MSSHAIVPRVYQLELFERAKDENIIVLLRTGAGKTLIAVELIKHYLLLHESQNASTPGGGRSPSRGRKEKGPHIVFLCPTKVLAVQQAEVISLMGTTGQSPRLKVDVLTGESRDLGGNNVDLWSDTSWRKFLSSQRVLVSTPELVRRALSKRHLRMNDIALLVVDECHHCCATRKSKPSNSPVALIFREHFHAVPRSERPRVLGLTASAVLGKTKSPEEIREMMTSLEQTMGCGIVTVRDTRELDEKVPKPTQEFLVYDRSEAETGEPEELMARSQRRAVLASKASKLRQALAHVTDRGLSMLICQAVGSGAPAEEDGPCAWGPFAAEVEASYTTGQVKKGPLPAGVPARRAARAAVRAPVAARVLRAGGLRK